MFIEALSHLSALSEMLSISLNAEKSPVGVFAIHKHFAALRLYSDRLAGGGRGGGLGARLVTLPYPSPNGRGERHGTNR